MPLRWRKEKRNCLMECLGWVCCLSVFLILVKLVERTIYKSLRVVLPECLRIVTLTHTWHITKAICSLPCHDFIRVAFRFFYIPLLLLPISIFLSWLWISSPLFLPFLPTLHLCISPIAISVPSFPFTPPPFLRYRPLCFDFPSSIHTIFTLKPPFIHLHLILAPTTALFLYLLAHDI